MRPFNHHTTRIIALFSIMYYMGIIYKNEFRKDEYEPLYLHLRLTFNFFLVIQGCIAIILPDFFDSKPILSVIFLLLMFVNFMFALTYPNKYKKN